MSDLAKLVGGKKGSLTNHARAERRHKSDHFLPDLLHTCVIARTAIHYHFQQAMMANPLFVSLRLPLAFLHLGFVTGLVRFVARTVGFPPGPLPPWDACNRSVSAFGGPQKTHFDKIWRVLAQTTLSEVNRITNCIWVNVYDRDRILDRRGSL